MTLHRRTLITLALVAGTTLSSAGAWAQEKVLRVVPHSNLAVLDPIFASRPLAHWRAELDRHTVTFGIITRVEDLPDDPQLNANGVFRPVVGPGVRPGLRTVDSPIHLDGAPKREPTRAPELGEHGQEILRSLGYSPGRIDSLVRSGVLKVTDDTKSG